MAAEPSDLPQQKSDGEKEYQAWVASVKDKKVKQVLEKIQVPLMLQLMKQAGMKKMTIEFIRKVFTEGAEYIDDVDISGLSRSCRLKNSLVTMSVLNLQS